MPYKGSSKYHGPSKDAVVQTESPGNGNGVAADEDTEVLVVNPDGTNAVDLTNAAEAGREILVYHNGGSNTPALSFTGGNVLNGSPSNATADGDYIVMRNVTGADDGWVLLIEDTT